MLRVGLTGGIASGKTTLSRLFAALGVPIIDADEISRRLSKPGQAGYKRIVEHFGKDILNADGELDRVKLRAQVFADPAQRRRLEALLHPLIFAAMDDTVAALGNIPYCILAIPLLVETDCRQRVDRVLVVDVPEAVQYRRLQARDGLNDDGIRQILAAQSDRQTRLQAADDVIHNDGSLAELERRVERLHQRYLHLSTAE
ncbi:MAG: dephospho-CoA kinase [Methylococcaceae bacterium]|nr:MAG: dephospho-CoA kinase [Methylococcaceae bacterium]